jgi:hypothetical protein
MSSQTLANFAGSFVKRLDERLDERLDGADVDKNDTEETSKQLLVLKEALTTAKTLLADIDTAKNAPDFKESLTTTLDSIRETINAGIFDIIPLDDKVGINKVYQALEIIDKISHKRLSNEKVDRYIQFSLG